MVLTTSKMEKGKFYLGQAELSSLIQRVVRYYRYHNNNQNPEEIVLPYLTMVEGVKVTYEQPKVEPGTGKSSGLRSPSSSKEQEATNTDGATG
jgi:hypothetical protein